MRWDRKVCGWCEASYVTLAEANTILGIANGNEVMLFRCSYCNK